MLTITGRGIMKPHIKRVELELTNTCDLVCKLCYRQTHPECVSGIKHRSKDEVIEQVKGYENLQFITLAGPTSEPTLHPELFDILRELIDMDLEISLFINGGTHDENFYRKLAVIFRRAKGNIYFTVCGSTQELHERYRVGSSLEKVIKHFKIVDKISDKAVMTWLIFNYNEDDFNKNKHMFDGYHTEYFYTLPIQEHFELDSDIHLPEPLHSAYKEIDRTDTESRCTAENYGFELISCDGTTNPCNLYKLYGKDRCFECTTKNAEFLRRHKIYHVCEPEDEYSEDDLRL